MTLSIYKELNSIIQCVSHKEFVRYCTCHTHALSNTEIVNEYSAFNLERPFLCFVVNNSCFCHKKLNVIAI